MVVFGRKDVLDCRDQLSEEHVFRWSGTHINRQISGGKQMWKWGAREELIPHDCYQRLLTVNGLRFGETNAPETEPITPRDIFARL